MTKIDFKYFIGYKDTKTIGPSLIFLAKMSAYRSDFEKAKCTTFLIKDDKLLKKCNEISEKASKIIKKKNLIAVLYTMENI